MCFVALAIACLAFVHNGYVVQAERGQLLSHWDKAHASSSSYEALAELKQPQLNGRVGMAKSLKVMAMLVLTFNDAAAGWQVSGDLCKLLSTPRGDSVHLHRMRQNSGGVQVGCRSSTIEMSDGKGATGVASVESELARKAGEEAVKSALESQKSVAQISSNSKGRPFLVTFPTKPLGLVLATNPSGRGVFISRVVPNSTAAEIGTLQPGDYVTSVFSGDKSFSCKWLSLDEVLGAIDQTPAPVKMRVRRGGPEPWSLERDGSGLSVEEMVQASKREYGKLLDDEKEDALRSAFAEIKEGERRAAAESAASGGYESEALKAASRADFELKSFALGVRNAISSAAQYVYNRALLDATIAVQTSEYLLRRAVYAALPVAQAVYAALPVSRGFIGNALPVGSAPFESMESSIETTRKLSSVSEDEAQLMLVQTQDVEEMRKREEEAAQKAREVIRKEAAALLQEAVGGVEAWARQWAGENEAKDGATAEVKEDEKRVQEPDWEALKQRANLLGGDVSVELKRGLEDVRRDFAAYQRLAKQGQLPTLMEQFEEALPSDGGAGSPITLGAFKAQATPEKQRKQLQKRRQAEREAKSAKFAAALGQRVSEDSADAVVYGVLPSAKAVGRMAARRVAQKVANKFGANVGQGGKKGGVVGELAQELSQAYQEDLKRGMEMGPLADLADAAKGPSQKLKEDLNSLGRAFNEAFEPSKKQTARPLRNANAPPTDLLQDEIEKTRNRVESLRKGEAFEIEDKAEVETLEVFAEALEVGAGAAKVEVQDDDVMEVEVEDVEVEVEVEVEPESDAADVIDSPDSSEISEVVDVGASAVKDTEEVLASKRNAALLDAILLTTEATLGTLSANMGEFLTPEGAREWRLLRVFAGQGSGVEQKAARARDKLLDELSEAARRK